MSIGLVNGLYMVQCNELYILGQSNGSCLNRLTKARYFMKYRSLNPGPKSP